MARLYLFAEGQTEQTFAGNLMTGHLAQYQLFMAKPLLIAHKQNKGRTHRGGGRSYLPMRNDILRFMKQEKAPDVFFTTMIDLYALSPDFPGLKASESLRHEPMKRVQFLEQQFAADIGDPRFIPYLQLHEYEAYLFCQPTGFYDVGADNKQVAELQAIADMHETPELINNGLHTAPSKRIAHCFPDYGKAKATYGPQVAEKIGLQRIRRKCPHFNEWLSKLESLGMGGADIV
jgi:hypothetical protein